jgi:hypothetical protein
VPEPIGGLLQLQTLQPSVICLALTAPEMERAQRIAEQVAPAGPGGGRKACDDQYALDWPPRCLLLCADSLAHAHSTVPFSRMLPKTLPSFTQVKVAVLGAAGGIGQPLSMLLKMSPLVGR